LLRQAIGSAGASTATGSDDNGSGEGQDGSLSAQG
jgi:hypothetical protein